MSKVIELQDELSGFTPGDEGSALHMQYMEDRTTIRVAGKYAVEFGDEITKDGTGWDWGLGITELNVYQASRLKNWLVLRIAEMEGK